MWTALSRTEQQKHCFDSYYLSIPNLTCTVRLKKRRSVNFCQFVGNTKSTTVHTRSAVCGDRENRVTIQERPKRLLIKLLFPLNYILTILLYFTGIAQSLQCSILGKDDLVFEVWQLVTEFPLLRNAQTLPSIGNRGPLSKVMRSGCKAEHTPEPRIKMSAAACLLHSMTSNCGHGQL